MTQTSYLFSIYTEVLGVEALPAVLEGILRFLERDQVATVKLVHGWVPDLAEQLQGEDAYVAVGALKKTIADGMAAGQILLGRVDLWIRNDEEDYEFQICNDADLHFFAKDPRQIDELTALWEAEGYKVYNPLKTKSPE